MRAYLEFELPEDDEAHQAAVDSQRLVFAITDMLEACRQTIKYDPDETAVEHATIWRDKLLNILDEREVTWVANR